VDAPPSRLRVTLPAQVADVLLAILVGRRHDLDQGDHLVAADVADHQVPAASDGVARLPAGVGTGNHVGPVGEPRRPRTAPFPGSGGGASTGARSVRDIHLHARGDLFRPGHSSPAEEAPSLRGSHDLADPARVKRHGTCRRPTRVQSCIGMAAILRGFPGCQRAALFYQRCYPRNRRISHPSPANRQREHPRPSAGLKSMRHLRVAQVLVLQ